MFKTLISSLPGRVGTARCELPAAAAEPLDKPGVPRPSLPPRPLIPAFSPDGGEGGRRPDEGERWAGRRRSNSLRLALLGLFLAGELLSAAPSDYLIRNWQSDDNLPSDQVNSIVQTRDGFLWLGTDLGLARFDGTQFKVFSGFTQKDLDNVSHIERLFETREGDLLMAGYRGQLVVYRKGQFTRLTPISHAALCGEYRCFLNTRTGETLIGEEGGILWRWQKGQLTALCTNAAIQKLGPNSLAEDALGQIWLAQPGGRLLRFAGGKLETVALPEEAAGETCRDFAVDAAGTLWLGTSRGLTRWQAGQFERVPLPETATPFAVEHLTPSHNGGLWLQHGNTFQKFLTNAWSSPAVTVTGLKSVTFLAEDSWDRLCVGTTDQGLLRLGTDGSMVATDTRQGLPVGKVLCRCRDREGNEWLGLDQAGLVRLRPRPVETLPSPSGKPGPVHAVAEDAQGDLWLTSAEEGLLHWDGTRYVSLPDGGLKNATCLLPGRNHFWIGTKEGLFEYRDHHFLPVPPPEQKLNQIYNLFEDSQERLWVGCDAGLWVWEKGQFTAVRPLGKELGPDHQNHYARTVAEDHQGRIWVGTSGDGLYCLEGGQWRVQAGLNGSYVLALFVDGKGDLWASTYGGGLHRWRNGQLSLYTTKQGLVDDFITHICEDQKDWLWLASLRKGVFRVDKYQFDAVDRGLRTSLSPIAYERADGLPSMDSSWNYQPAGCTTRDGRMLLPTLRGLAVLQPRAIQYNPLQPPVFVESLLLDGSPAALPSDRTRPFVVPPGVSGLEISFNALCYAAPEKIRFRHILRGLEEKEIEVGTSRTVSYYHLPPGDYEFQVTACNNDGIWSQTGATLAITVQAYFWQMPAFRIGAGGLALAAVGWGVWLIGRRRSHLKLQELQQAQAVERERVRIARDMHDELGSRLTQAGLIATTLSRTPALPEPCRKNLVTLQETIEEMTLSMDELVWVVNPQHDTLDGLANYLVRYTQEFLGHAALECVLDVPADLPSAGVPSAVRHNLFLAYKEALRNCVRHARAKTVRVSLRAVENRIRLAVADDGRGFDPEPVRQLGRGQENMRSRLAALGGTCRIESGPGKGTRVEFEVPLPPAMG